VTTNTVANIPMRRPILGFSRHLQVESAGASWYSGLELSVTKRFSRGLQFLASYTWSKSLDSDGVAVDTTSQAGGNIGNQNDPRQRYGPSSFHRPHRFVFSYVYELPVPPNLGALTGRLLSGWAVTGVTTIQSGRNLTITGTNSNNIFGITTDRAQLAAGCTHDQLVTSGPAHEKLNSYFNATCFTGWPIIGNDGIGTDFGNSGTGIVSGPDQRNFDIGILKRTQLTESTNLEFRAELFNAFNTPQFADPITDRTSATFGTITSTKVSPRIVQLALKLNF
jgi:hypothetical protein